MARHGVRGAMAPRGTRDVVCACVLVLTTAYRATPATEPARAPVSRGPEPRRLEWQRRPETPPLVASRSGDERLVLSWTLPSEWSPPPFAYTESSSSPEEIDDEPGDSHTIFVDAHRVLVSSRFGTELSVVEVPSGKRLAHVVIQLGEDHFLLGHAVSPDGMYVTVLERHGEDMDLDLLVWKIGERSVLRRALPAHVCEATCVVTWRSKTELVLTRDDGQPTTYEGRLDLRTSRLRVVPRGEGSQGK